MLNQDKRVLLRETALQSQIKVYQCADTSSTLILLTTKSSPAMKLATPGTRFQKTFYVPRQPGNNAVHSAKNRSKFIKIYHS